MTEVGVRVWKDRWQVHEYSFTSQCSVFRLVLGIRQVLWRSWIRVPRGVTNVSVLYFLLGHFQSSNSNESICSSVRKWYVTKVTTEQRKSGKASDPT